MQPIRSLLPTWLARLGRPWVVLLLLSVTLGVHECGGTRWRAVLAAAARKGLTPPVLTDYLDLSVGGTLSAGGIGGASHHHGPQADHILDLEVVTPAGEIITCAPSSRPDVFFGVLAGQGRPASLPARPSRSSRRPRACAGTKSCARARRR